MSTVNFFSFSSVTFIFVQVIAAMVLCTFPFLLILTIIEYLIDPEVKVGCPLL